MKKITDFLRKIGVLHVSKGDYQTGEFDNRADLKEEGEKCCETCCAKCCQNGEHQH